MRKIHILTGQQIGSLRVLAFAGIRNHQASWLCLCACGKATTVRGSRLKSGLTRSCGCIRRGQIRGGKGSYRSRFLDRFWAKVDRTPGLGPNGDCWEWIGSRKEHGYGQFGLYRRRAEEIGIELHSTGAHVISYVLRYGNFQPGLFVCHSCDNPPCVNPDHLFVGTPRDNTRDAQAKGRFPVAEMRVPRRVGRQPRLSAAAVVAIRAAQESRREIAARFGISETHVGRIKNGSVSFWEFQA